MKKLPLSLLFISLSAVRAAEDDITILQRDGTNKNAPVTINGATHAGKTLGFNATTGVLQAMDTGLFSGATVTLGGGASSLELRFLEPSGGGTSYTGFKAPALAGSVMYTLPAAAGTEGQVLAATATPTTLEWATPASGSFDSAAVDATTWSDGANASNVWTFDLSGTDPEITFASGAVQVSAGIFQIGTVTPTVPTENPAMQIARTVTGTGDHAHGFFDGSNFVAAGFGYNSFDAIPHVTGASDHSCGFQARQHHAPGGGNTIAKWYGFFARPYIDSGITTEIQQVRLVNATLSGGGTVPGVQYGLRVDDFTSSSFYNVPLGIDGSSTGSTQAIQASWHQPRISFGTGNVPSNNNQVEITPLASTVSGRTGLAITGGSTTGAGSLPALSIAQTWNTSGSPALIYGRVTNTASGASSMLLDLGTVANGSLFSVSKTGTLAVADNVRQTFNPGADAAGINVGSHAGDPGTPANGDLWYDSTANELTARINGANVALGAGAGGSVATDAIWDAAGDLAYGTGANTGGRLAVGTANQLLQVNAGATAPEWTSSVNLTTVTATTGNIGSLVFEGATADAFETTIAVTDPTADRTWTLGNVSATITATDGATLTFQGTDTYVGRATTDTLTNKTLDASGTGNVVKMFGYLVLTHPHVFGSGVTQQTTVTANTYGQALFANATDKATNYVEYYCVIPPDIDTAVDLTATFKFKLSAADTNDHEYEITFDSVADSAAYAGTLADAISLAYTADGSGAQNDVETAGETTLTGWRSAMTAGQLMVIRVARDGDHASDTSTVNSYSGPLVIKYGITQ